MDEGVKIKMHLLRETIKVTTIIVIFVLYGCDKFTVSNDLKINKPVWEFASKGGIQAVALTSKGDNVAIFEVKETNQGRQSSFLHILNKQGRDQLSYDFQRNISVLDLKFSPNDKYIAVALGSMLTKGGQIFLFDTEKLLWSKAVWGRPYFMSKPDKLAIARYDNIRGIWDEEQLPIDRVCLDPNYLVGEYSSTYTIRGKTIYLDMTGKQIGEDNKLTGLSKILDNNYLVTTCIGKTTIFDTKGQPLWTSEDSGDINVSSDNKFISIYNYGNVSFYENMGKLLWKKANMYPVVPLPGGNFVTKQDPPDYNSTKAGYYKAPDYIILSFNNVKGEKIWEKKQESDGYGPILFSVTPDGKYIAVNFQKKIEVKKIMTPELKNIVEKWGAGDTVMEFINKVALISHDGNIAWISNEVQTERTTEYIVTDYAGDHVVISDGSRVLFYETGIKGSTRP